MTPQQIILTLAGLVGAATAAAQHVHGGHGSGPSHAPGPYAGMQSRAVKALSAQEMDDLRAGKGLSMALPAELNGYPGPAHVLELAAPLKLTHAQSARTEELFRQMQAAARSAGEDLIAAETALDALFKDRRVTPGLLTEAVSRAAAAQGRLRETHLRYHLLMMDVLGPEQVAAYGRLRGYAER